MVSSVCVHPYVVLFLWTADAVDVVFFEYSMST
jgi:hypothetical protein